jgi:hypothetical protein
MASNGSPVFRVVSALVAARPGVLAVGPAPRSGSRPRSGTIMPVVRNDARNNFGVVRWRDGNGSTALDDVASGPTIAAYRVLSGFTTGTEAVRHKRKFKLRPPLLQGRVRCDSFVRGWSTTHTTASAAVHAWKKEHVGLHTQPITGEVSAFQFFRLVGWRLFHP